MIARSLIMLLATVINMGGHEGGDATAQLQCVIDDYVREVVEEAKGVRVIYTNGVFDDDIRREAKRRGIELEPVSMLKKAPDALKGGPVSLRIALEESKDVALQLGFELWKCRGRELPLCSGVLARTGKMPEEDRQRGIEVARQLGERILTLYEKGVVDSVDDKKLKDRFLFVQWRIARIARMRAEREDREGLTKLALKDVAFADRLDEYNDGLKKISQEMDKVREQTLRIITPRESLQLALARCDFAQARRHAELILKDDPDDPDANFAVGMDYYCRKQWAGAEEYLRRCLIKKPKQVAVWNNLGMIYMRMGRYDEGLKCAKRALEICPESAEVKDTIKQIESARDKAKARKR